MNTPKPCTLTELIIRIFFLLLIIGISTLSLIALSCIVKVMIDDHRKINTLESQVEKLNKRLSHYVVENKTVQRNIPVLYPKEPVYGYPLNPSTLNQDQSHYTGYTNDPKRTYTRYN